MIGIYEVRGQTLITEEDPEHALVTLQLPEVVHDRRRVNSREFLRVRLHDYDNLNYHAVIVEGRKGMPRAILSSLLGSCPA